VIGTPRKLIEGEFKLSQGGDARLYDITKEDQKFLMVEGIIQPPTPVTQMILVQNWFEELKRLVPAGNREFGRLPLEPGHQMVLKCGYLRRSTSLVTSLP